MIQNHSNSDTDNWQVFRLTCTSVHLQKSMTETLSSLAFWWDFLVSYESKRFSLLKRRKLEKSNQTNHLVHWVSYLFIHFWRQMHPNVYLPIFADEQPAELQDGLTSGSKGQHGGQLIKLLFTFATFNILKHATSPFPRLQWWQTPRPSNWKRKIYQPDTYFEMRCQFWRRTTKIQKTLLSSQVFWLPTNGSLFTLKIKLFMRKPEI